MLWSWNSDAFGTTLANEDVDNDNNDFEFNLRFPGQYFDKESGIHYNYFRDYEPATGRYLQSDPIGQKGALNTYTYASNNSLYWTDSTGMINDNGRCTGLPIQFQQDCRNPPPPPSCKDGGYCSCEERGDCCEERGDCCEKSFFSCMDDCVSFLNPWWSTSVGGAVGFGAAGAAGTTATVACGWGGAAAGAWGLGTTAGCLIRCTTNPCYKY
ncbi:hypothetical protein MNBD_GAMMA01-2004 [hydrothermal vent metagenome]|uniref:Rhs-family protein n=1 Tax=hydrothermal vent metagenome TaxID=652676 RepID=A0A3B0VA00_9ZZZZ